jgi:hypothetical protein
LKNVSYQYSKKKKKSDVSERREAAQDTGHLGAKNRNDRA